MRETSACTVARENVPRGFDWISAVSCSSLAFLLPSKAIRLMTGFSITVTTTRPPDGLILHVLEQAGAVERLEGGVDPRGIETVAAAGAEIRTDGIGLDPLVAFDDDLRCRLRARKPCRADARGNQHE